MPEHGKCPLRRCRMKERHSGTGFRDVDETGDAGYFVQYLDAVSALEAAQE